MASTKSIILLADTSRGYDRGIVTGISNAVRTGLKWCIRLVSVDLDDPPPEWLFTDASDGIISRISNRELVDRFAKDQRPFIDLNDRVIHSNCHALTSDDHAIGSMAAEYFIERGQKNFGFCGFENSHWSDARRVGFAEKLQQRGYAVSTIETPDWEGSSQIENETLEQLRIWIRALDRPIGILASNDRQAKQLLHACLQEDINVPDEISVLGVDDDEVQCQLSPWPLSSIVPGAEMVGYKSALWMEDLIAGTGGPPTTHRVQPICVETRKSTDAHSTDDLELAEALSYMRENACKGISVKDVLRQIPISRTSLEKGVKRLLGRTPKAELRYLQVLEVIRLLRDTSLPITEIASQCGFKHPEYLSVVVKRETGKTPGMIRNEVD
ncbi:MAG: DNA-binding transcriptional regulator [Planctomycetota bacterium]